MEDKIETGEYIRTVDGKFGMFDRYSSRKKESYYKSPFDCFIKLQNRKTPLQCCSHYIKNHRKNIIDLVEEGDIVILEDELVEYFFYMYDKSFIEAVKQDIEKGRTLKSILTKEQLESTKYEVEHYEKE